MNDSHFLSLAWTQLIQVSVLIAVVWLLVKLFARQRPHLAYALWLIVLVKCLTPPVMSSPTGLMSHLTIPKPAWLTFESPVEVEEEQPEPVPVDLAPEFPPDPLPELQVSEANFDVDDLSRGIVVDEDELPPEFFTDVELEELEEEFLGWDEPPPAEEPDVPDEPVAAVVPVTSKLWKIWLGSAGVVLLITFARVLITLRRVYRYKVATPAELESLVAQLSLKLKLGRSNLVAEVARTSGEREPAPELWRVRLRFCTRFLERLNLRRKVRVLVTAARVGPAVVGFFRPLLILPEVIVFRRNGSGGSLRSTPATQADTTIDVHGLEPIIAHELLHVKRGDPGVGWLQVLVQSLWWFHPLVWLVNRFLSREAERCCDEAVVAELGCPPAAYARCLLNVLEQKRNLTPIPACPGVKPVELTKQRMERIMKLGQGCRNRSPWWCWLVVVLLGVVVLPGRGESKAEQKQPAVKFRVAEGTLVEYKTRTFKPGSTTKADKKRLSSEFLESYSIPEIIELFQSEYRLDSQDAKTLIESFVKSSVSTYDSTIGQADPQRFRVAFSGDTLTVKGPREVHEHVKGLLKTWRESGLVEMTFEVVIAEGPVEFSAGRVTGWKQSPTVLTAALSDKKRSKLMDSVQSDPRSNVLTRPQIRTINGQRATIQVGTVQPFVTGVKRGKPVTEFFESGVHLVLSPTVDADDRIALSVDLQFSEIGEVSTKKLKQNGGHQPATIQVPDARRTELHCRSLIKEGETLLIGGLAQQFPVVPENRMFLLIKPRLVKVGSGEWLRDENSPSILRVQHESSAAAPARAEQISINLRSADPDEPSTLLYRAGRFSAEYPTTVVIPKFNADELEEYSKAIQKAAARLGQSAEVEYFQLPLTHALLNIHQKTGLRIVLDHAGLEAAGISPETKVDLNLSGVRWKTVLHYALGEQQLGFCLVPVRDAVEDIYIPTIVVTTLENLVDVSLTLRSQSIPVICAPDDFHYQKVTPATEKILKVLEKPLDQDFRQTPFLEFTRHIARTHGISIVLPPIDIKEVQSWKVDYRAGSFRLGKFLEETCKPHGLTFHVDDEVAMITRTEQYENQIITVRYQLGGVAPADSPHGQKTRHALIDHIKKTIAPESWKNTKEFRIVPVDGQAAVLIRQKRKVHQQIREQAAKKMPGVGINSDAGVTGSIVLDERNFERSPEPATEYHTVPKNTHDLIISSEFENVSLKAAIKQICEAGNLKVEYDVDELGEEGISLDAPVTFAVFNETALQALAEMLKPFELELVMEVVSDKDHSELPPAQVTEVLKIEIRPTAVLDRLQTTVNYPIGDLLERDKSLQGTVGVPMLDKIPHQDRLFQARPRTKAERADALIDVLEKALAWDGDEADETTGIIKFSEQTEALVIRCNRTQHDLIAKLLCERRGACGIENKSAMSADEESADVTGDNNGTSAIDPELWQLLVEWERASKRYKRLSSRHRRFVYDSVFQVEKRSEGTVYFEAPDKGRIDFKPVTIAPNAKSQRLTPQGKPFSLKSDVHEIWIRDGKQIAQARDNGVQKFYTVYDIPEKIRDHFAWLSMFGPAGEFLGGMSAEEAVKRYHITLIPKTDENHVWMEVVPKRAEDMRNWKQSCVILDRKSYLPLAIQMFDPVGTTETVYRFENFKVNGNADEGQFDITEALKEYKLVQPNKLEERNGDANAQPEEPKAEPPKPAEAKPDQRPKENRLLTISFPVADLVVPYAEVVSPLTREDTEDAGDDVLKFDDPLRATANRAGELSTPAPVVQSTDGTKTAMKQNLKSLAELIKKSVQAEEGWHPDGQASLMVSETTISLVIRARQSTLDEIADLFADLRRKQDLQVTLECLTVRFEKDSFSDFRTNVGIDFETVDSAPKNSQDPLILYCVKNDDFHNKVKKFEQAEILSFPKMTVFNGVGAQIQISRDEADERQAKNIHYMIVPTASEDRRTVDVRFAVNPTSTLDVLSKAKSMTIPDGQSVLIEVTDELLTSPKRTGVPEIDKALRELKKKELGVRTFVLLTPRIIIQEEEEALLGIPQ